MSLISKPLVARRAGGILADGEHVTVRSMRGVFGLTATAPISYDDARARAQLSTTAPPPRVYRSILRCSLIGLHWWRRGVRSTHCMRATTTARPYNGWACTFNKMPTGGFDVWG